MAGAASDLALLAGALAALGRELAAAEEIRDLAAGSPPERARELRLRARDVEDHAQDRWRAAVASYEGGLPRAAAVGRPPRPQGAAGRRRPVLTGVAALGRRLRRPPSRPSGHPSRRWTPPW